MNHQILIPSCRDDVSEQLGEILSTDRSIGDDVIYSCSDASAAINRNECLKMADAEYVVMIDDDITGFFPGWSSLMVAPLNDPSVLYVSARLMNECGSPQMVMGFSKNVMSPHVAVNIAPSACIAFRNDGTRFCEEYFGSGFEDSDFHFQLKEKYGYDKKVVVNNGVKLIHTHEMKNQNGIGSGKNWFDHNQAIFDKRWPGKRRMLGV